MSAVAEKRQGAERVAWMDVKSSYRDIRDGIGGGGGTPQFTAQDVAAALGWMAAKDEDGRRHAPREAVWVLETYYGGSLRFEHRLRSLWAEQSESPGDPTEDRIRNRVAAALVIRSFAGAKFDSEAWSDLMHENPKAFACRVRAVGMWLDDLLDQGQRALSRALEEGSARKGARSLAKGKARGA